MQRWIAVVAAAASLAACEKADSEESEETFPAELVEVLPRVPGARGVAVDPGGPRVVIHEKAIQIAGEDVVVLEEWSPPASEKRSHLSLVVPEITDAVNALDASAGDGPLQIAAHRDAPYRILITVLASAKHAPAEVVRFVMLVDAGSVAGLPIELPQRKPVEAAGSASRTADAERLEWALRKRLGAAIAKCGAKVRARPATVRLTFRMQTEDGRVSRAKVGSFDEQVSSCLQTEMVGWPVPDSCPSNDAPGTRLQPLLRPTIEVSDWPAVVESGEVPVSGSERPGCPEVDLAPGLVVAVSSDHLVLFSTTGLEGSMSEPKLRLEKSGAGGYDTDRLRATLEEIVTRRWPDGERSDESKEIVLVADSGVPLRLVAPVLAAIRSTAGGSELFPGVALGAGFR